MLFFWMKSGDRNTPGPNMMQGWSLAGGSRRKPFEFRRYTRNGSIAYQKRILSKRLTGVQINGRNDAPRVQAVSSDALPRCDVGEGREGVGQVEESCWLAVSRVWLQRPNDSCRTRSCESSWRYFTTSWVCSNRCSSEQTQRDHVLQAML